MTTPVITPSAGPLAGLASLRGSLFGDIGGAAVGGFAMDKKMSLGLFSDGLYERRQSDVGAFVYKFQDLKVPYLSSLGAGTSSFQYTLPKPGIGILWSIRDFFADIMKKMSDAEVMIQLFWDKQEEKYFIYVPEQKVAKATIAFKHSEELQSNPTRYLWVLDLHSHNTMGAFFSGTDSADETSTRVFGVMGTISRGAVGAAWKDSVRYTAKWRAGVNGKFIELAEEDIWNIADETPMPILEADYSKVTQGYGGYTPYVAPVYTGYRAPAAGQHHVSQAGGYDYYEDDYAGFLPRGKGKRGGWGAEATGRAIIDTSDRKDVQKAFHELYSTVEYRDVAIGIYNFEVRESTKKLDLAYIQTITDGYNKMLSKLVEKTDDLTDDELAQVIIASASEHFGEEVVRKAADRFQDFKSSETVQG